MFVPNKPIHRYVAWKISRFLGLRVTSNSRRRYDLAILWEVSTYVTHESQLLAGSLQKRTLNRALHDISKRNVDKHFTEIFGYSLLVDPTMIAGHCVMKSNHNAKHDGRIIECPLEHPNPDFVYQRLIDNRCAPDVVVDLRVPVINQVIPFVYKKYRPLSTRFSNRNTRVEICNADDVFTPGELGQLLAVARSIGLDLGELDVLRDAESHRIYVVDVNNTPSGPPNHLPLREQVRAVQKLATAFEQEILRAGELSPPSTGLPAA